MKKLQRADVIKHVLALVSGVIVMLWTLYLMVSPAKYALGFVLLLITFVLAELLLSERDVRTTVQTAEESDSAKKRRRFPTEELIVAAYAASMSIVYLVSPIQGEIWLWWDNLASAYPLNVVRLIAAFGFNFFPGYVILLIAGKRGQFQGLLKLVTSYLLSLFIISTIGFISGYLRGVLDEFFLNAFLSVNIAIIAAYLLHRFFDWRRPKISSEFSSDGTGTPRSRLSAVLLLLTVVFLAVWLLWPYSQIGFFIGGPGSDMWRHLGDAAAFLDNRAFAWLQVPWWFELYIASFAVISGAPLANAYSSLYPLMAVLVVSFYLMVTGFTKDTKVAAVATLLYTVFSGFAWAYAVYMRDFVEVPPTWIGILYNAGDKFLYQAWYPPFSVGLKHSVVSLTALWWMVYAVRRLNLKNKFNFLLMSSIWAVSYLFHVVDGLVFFVFLAVLLIFYLATHDLEGKKRIRAAALAVFLALGFVTVTELAITYQYFTYTSFFAPVRRYYYLYSASFFFAAAASVSVFILSYLRVPRIMHNFLTSKYQALKSKAPSWINPRLGVEAIFYIYGISMIVWILLLGGFHSYQLTLGQAPWYVYPAILGVTLILGLVGVSFLLLEWKKLEKGVRNALVFGALSSAFLIIMGVGVTALNVLVFYTGGGERAILTYYTRGMVAILAGYALFEIFRRVVPKKPLGRRYTTKVVASTLLVSLLVLAGVSSTLIAQDFESSEFFSVGLSENERQALTYLYYSLPRGYVAYLAKSSGTSYIRAFANDKWWDDPGLWLGGAEWQSARSPTPENVISTMKRTDAAYIYYDRNLDSQVLARSLLLQLFLSVLPVAFNNSEVTIYSVPPTLQGPTSSASELGIIKPAESDGSAYDAYVFSLFMAAFSGTSYTILNGVSDPNIEGVSKTILLPYDPVPHSENESMLFDWTAKGGDLVVFNTNTFGAFEEWFGLRPKEVLLNCDTDTGWSKWANRGTISVETTEKVEGNASLRFSFDNLQAYQWSGWIYNITQAEGKPWNLSDWDYLSVWIYANRTTGPQWYLKLYDSYGVSGQYGGAQFLSVWNGRDYIQRFSGWQQVLIPIRQYYGNLDLANVTRLEMSTGFVKPVDMLVDEIAVYENMTNDAYIVNSIVGNQTVDLPTIAVQSINIGSANHVSANYSLDGLPLVPFAVERYFGAGNASFVNILQLNDFMLSEIGKLQTYDMLVKIYEILRIIPMK